MTKRFDGFDDWNVHVIGTNSPGLTVRGGGAPGRATKYADAGVVPRNERYLEFLTDSTADYCAVSVDALDADANRATFDIVDAFSYDLLTAEEWTLYARGQGSGTVTDFVRARVVKASGVIAIDRMVAGAYTAGSGASAGSVTLSAGKSHLVRFRGVAGAVSLKVWDAALGMAGEPAAFNLTPTGLTPTAAGWIGMGGRHSTLTAKVAPHNFIATATNGDVAVCPITDAEFVAWMNDDTKRRCATVQMTAVGYNSTTPPYTKTVKGQFSNMGYNAHEQDGLANPHFLGIITKVPTFSVDLPSGFSGAGSTSVGEMVISNPAAKGDARQNLLNYSNYNAARWTDPFGLATFTTGQSDPMGGTEAVRINLSAAGTKLIRVTPGYTLTAQGQYICAFWMKLVSGTPGPSTADINDDAASVTTVGTQLVLGQWVLIQLNPAQFASAATLAHIDVINNTTGTYTVDVYGLHLRQATRDPRYIGTAGAAYNPTVLRRGVRDVYLQYAWNRDGYALRLGDPARPWHDHRVILRGRVGIPKAPSVSRIAFPLADMSDALNVDINSSVYASGAASGQRKPELFGSVVMCEPIPTDLAGLVWQISRRAIDPAFVFYDQGNFVLSIASLTVSSVDAGLDELTLSANHGMTPGFEFTFDYGTVPAHTGTAINIGDLLYVKTVSALNKVTLSRTLGGATIDFTGGPTGADVSGKGYRLNAAAGTVTKVNSQAGRITCRAKDTAGSTSGKVFGAMLSAGALSANVKDSISFDALDTLEASYINFEAGLWVGSEKTSVAECFTKYANGTFSWYVPVPDGRIQVGRYALPGTPVDTLTEADIKAGSMSLVDVIRPIDMSKAEMTAAPFFLTGGFLSLPLSDRIDFRQNIAYQAPYSYGLAGTPIENYPPSLDANRNARFDTLMVAGAGSLQTEIANFFKWKSGVFQMPMRLRGVMYKLGSTVRVKHSRLGWEVYNAANPVSPDNTTTIDSELAVVVGKSFDLKKPFPIGLKLWRPIHAVFPTADIT